MYIRRKVYSAFEDYDGEIRYFSTNEIVSEEDYLEALYSEDYLDDDDMERLFAEKDDDRKGLSKNQKIALGVGGGLGAAAAGTAGTYHAAKGLAKKYGDAAAINAEAEKALKELDNKLARNLITKDQYEKQLQRLTNKTERLIKRGENAAKVEEKLAFVGKAEGAVGRGAKKAWGATERGAKKAWNWTKEKGVAAGNKAKSGYGASKSWVKAHPGATGAVLGAAAATGAAIGINEYNKRKNQ